MRIIPFFALLLVSSVSFSLNPQLDWQNSRYFNTDLLRNKTAVCALLKLDGFEEKTIKTPDGLELTGLYKAHPQAKYTMIFYAGWLTAKEKAAPFFPMMHDQPCNLLFIDGRNTHWLWPIWRKIWQFGIYEYNDIVGAVQFCHNLNGLPIFIHGLCAACYNIIQALLHMQQSPQAKDYGIKGLILDGAWGSRERVIQTAPYATGLEAISNFLYNSRHFKALKKKDTGFRWLTKAFSVMYACTYQLFFKPWISSQEKATNIVPKIDTLHTPMFFIHSYDDQHAAIDQAQELAKRAHNATTWWITEPSKHSCNHLKFKEEYKEKMISFINNCLA